MAHGTIKWYDKKKGYGFIAYSDGPDVFVHYTSMSTQGTILNDGDQVAFEIMDGEKGLRADKVTIQQPT